MLDATPSICSDKYDSFSDRLREPQQNDARLSSLDSDVAARACISYGKCSSTSTYEILADTYLRSDRGLRALSCLY